jgi:hypothetical protein
MSDIFQEVEEDLRRERYDSLWARYGRQLIMIVVAVVLGTAIGVGWNSYRQSVRSEQTRELAEAAEQQGLGLHDEAMARLGRIGDGTDHDGVALLARLREGAILVESGDLGAAAAHYRALAESSDIPPLYRDLARLLALYAAFDQTPPAELEPGLTALAQDDGPWRHSARELQALLALKQGDGVAARDLLSQIAADPTAPGPLRARVAEMVDMIGQ